MDTEKRRAQKAAWHRANKDKRAKQSRENWLRRTYGITADDYDRMLAAQGSVCAICGTDEPRGNGAFHVDHCHSTGKVRALLCAECNVGLGKFKDDAAILSKAISYLNSYTLVHNG